MKVTLNRMSGGVALALILWGVQAGAQEQRVIVQALTEEAPLFARTLEHPNHQVSDYWIGVMCEPVEGLLKEHLQIEQGLVVQEVVDESPAASAGLQSGDIVLSVGGEGVGDIQQLIAMIDEAEDNVIELEVLRKGESMTIEVTPASRPERQSLSFEIAPEAGSGEQWSVGPQRLFFPQGDGEEQRLYYFQPGVVFGAGSDLPDDVSVNISKQGDEPATIRVERGDDSWEVTEDEIDELPEDIQPFIRRLVGGQHGFSIAPRHFQVAPQVREGQLQVVPRLELRRFQPADGAEVRERVRIQMEEARRHAEEAARRAGRLADDAPDAIEELREEVRQLREELEELRSRRGRRTDRRSDGGADSGEADSGGSGDGASSI